LKALAIILDVGTSISEESFVKFASKKATALLEKTVRNGKA